MTLVLNDLDLDQIVNDTQKCDVQVDTSPTGHDCDDTQYGHASRTPFDSGQHCHDTQMQHAAVDLSNYAALRVLSELYADAQETRIRYDNRAAAAKRQGAGVDISDHFEAAKSIEHNIGLELHRQYRRTVPTEVRNWQKDSLGIGEHLLARLIGQLGHPAIAIPQHWEGDDLIADEPYKRSVSELWQYCGHGRLGRVQKGATQSDLMALGRPVLKKLVHLLSESAIKQPGRDIQQLLCEAQTDDDTQLLDGLADPSTTQTKPDTTPIVGTSVWYFRAVYEQRRLATVGRLHNADCVRCGPSGHPAPVGSPWNDGHAHNDALRIVGKEILRALWRVAQS